MKLSWNASEVNSNPRESIRSEDEAEWGEARDGVPDSSDGLTVRDLEREILCSCKPNVRARSVSALTRRTTSLLALHAYRRSRAYARNSSECEGA
jgi:hypothetical protein